MFINLSPVPGVISIPEAVPVFARPFRRKRKFFGDEEFNIETAAYTPPSGETVEAPSWVKEWVAQYEPSQTTWPSETRFVTTYQPPSITPSSSVSIKQPTEEGWLPVLKSLISGATIVGSKYLETRAQEKRIKAGLPPVSPIVIPKQQGILSSLGISTNTALLLGAGVLGVALIKKKGKTKTRVVYRRRKK